MKSSGHRSFDHGFKREVQLGGAMVKLGRAQVVFGVSVALVVVLVTPAAAQSSASAGKVASAKTNDKPWTAPKTPWGDPDLQGTWTTDSAFGIPLQRPQQFAGRAELNDEEFVQKVERDSRTRTNAENANSTSPAAV